MERVTFDHPLLIYMEMTTVVKMTRGRPFSQLIILLVRRDGVVENFANGRATYYICAVVPNCNFITMTVASQCRVYETLAGEDVG